MGSFSLTSQTPLVLRADFRSPRLDQLRAVAGVTPCKSAQSLVEISLSTLLLQFLADYPRGRWRVNRQAHVARPD